jgi:hypothetical protein
MFDQGSPPLTAGVKVMLAVWFVILVPWFPFFTLMGTGMAFESGYTLEAYLFVIAVWTYPALVGIAYFFRRRKPEFIMLPILTFMPLLASSVVHHH